MYEITYINPRMNDKLQWIKPDRKQVLEIVRALIRIFDDEGSLIIHSFNTERYWIHSYLSDREFDVHKHANGGYSTIFGNSYKTIDGALNKLDKLAATDRH